MGEIVRVYGVHVGRMTMTTTTMVTTTTDRPTDGNDIVNDIVVAVHRVTVQWAFVEVQWRIFRLMQPNEKADRAANHS